MQCLYRTFSLFSRAKGIQYNQSIMPTSFVLLLTKPISGAYRQFIEIQWEISQAGYR